MKKQLKGFTLIELMITVAIVGILAAIAIPNYQSSVKKSRRADAQGALASFANAMERYFTVNNTYCDAVATSGTVVANCGGAAADKDAPPLAAVFPSTQSPIDGATKYYNLTISNAGSNTYTLRAVPIATAGTNLSTAQNGDGILELSSTGVKGWDKNNNGTIDYSDSTENNWNN